MQALSSCCVSQFCQVDTIHTKWVLLGYRRKMLEGIESSLLPSNPGLSGKNQNAITAQSQGQMGALSAFFPHLQAHNLSIKTIDQTYHSGTYKGTKTEILVNMEGFNQLQCRREEAVVEWAGSAGLIVALVKWGISQSSVAVTKFPWILEEESTALVYGFSLSLLDCVTLGHMEAAHYGKKHMAECDCSLLAIQAKFGVYALGVYS